MILRFIATFLLGITTLFGVKSQELFFEQVMGDGEMPNTSIHGIAKDSMGYIWVGSWHGLYRYDGSRFEVFRHSNKLQNSLSSNRIRNVIADDNKQLWTLTFDNQYQKFDYQLSHFTMVPDTLVPNNVSVLLNSSSNLINKSTIVNDIRYVKENNHLVAVNRHTKTRKIYTSDLLQPGGLSDDFITSFYIDEQAIIWLGTRSGILYKANTNRKPFHLFHLYADQRTNIKPTPVRVIYKEEQRLWLGTNHNGLHTLGQQPNFNLNVDQQVRCIEKDAVGNIWIGGANGLGYVDVKSGQYHSLFTKQEQPNKVVSVYDMANTIEKNHIWVAQYNTLLKYNISTKEAQPIALENTVGYKSIMGIAEAPNGHVWLATEGSGVVRLMFDTQGNCTDTLVINSTVQKNATPLTGNLVYAIHIDRAGNIWAGTSEGLNLINGNDLTVKNIPLNEATTDSYIAAIAEDKKGNIWVSHKKGISRITPNLEVSNYPIKTGNRNWAFLDGACFNDTASNTLYFGATQGYITFNPDAVKKNPFAPTAEFYKLYIADNEIIPNKQVQGEVLLTKALALTSAITLPYNNRNFSVLVSTLHYEKPENNLLSYQLEGYDNEWHTSAQKLISYSKIPAGTYALNVKAITPDGVESATKTLQITILSPWYATHWAIAGYVLFIMLMLFVTYREILVRERLKNKMMLERINIEKKEELNRDRIEFFTNVSHELRTPLTLLTDPIKQLKKRELPAEKRDNYLNMVSRNLEHLSTLINQLLDFRKVEAGKLKVSSTIEDAIKLTRQCTESFYMNASNRNIDLKFQSNTKKLLCYIDRNKVEQILYNLISNAFKYTSNGGKIAVTTEVKTADSLLIITIKDNGVGIEQEALSKIFEPFNTVGNAPFDGNSSGIGLALTRNLITVLEGDISLNSTPQQGTTVTVTLPFKLVSEQEAALENQTQATSLEPSVINREEPSNHKPILLIVEDNTDVQEYLRSELEEEYNIYQEMNGIDGLKTAEATIPDLIISDVMMPFMDGVELCRAIKEQPQTCHIPLILLTAKSAEESRIEGLNTGADYYISKPFSMEVLKAQLSSIVENRIKLQKALAGEKHLSALEKANSGIDNAFIERAIAIIHQNIASVGFNNQQLAEELAISQRQLYRKIRALSGSTIQEFIIRVKMDEAAKMLLETSHTVSEISYSLGFSEPSNFSRTFTRHYGQSPTKWLKANK